MGKIRVLAIETHYLGTDGKERLSAVDFWRIINPLKHVAQNHKDISVDFKRKIVRPGKNEDDEWERVGDKYDILYTSYIDTPKAYAYIKATCMRFGMKHIMDLDDNLFEVDQMNPVYLRYYPGSESLKNAGIIVSDCDAMSVTTPHLKQVCDGIRGGKPVKVLHNYIDPEVYKYDPDRVPQNGDKIVIGYQGSSTHYSDLFNTGVMWAIRDLMRQHENLHFYIIGTPIDEILDYLPRERVLMEGGERDHRKWIGRWQELPIDIGIAPLVNSNFNRGKSNIKWQEYSLRFIPAVYSYVEPYRDSVVEGKTGLLAKDELEWREKLDWLIQNPGMRKTLAKSAQKEVIKNWTIQDNYEGWYEYLTDIADSR